MILEALLFFLPGIILGTYSLIQIFDYIYLRKKCTVSVNAKINKLYLKYSNSMEQGYFPVFKFVYDGIEYEAETKRTRYTNDDLKGKEVEILINPDKPSEIFDFDSSFVIEYIICILISMWLMYKGIGIYFGKSTSMDLFKF